MTPEEWFRLKLEELKKTRGFWRETLILCLEERIIRLWRQAYREQRKKQLEAIAEIKGEVPEDDLELFEEFKWLRMRANEWID